MNETVWDIEVSGDLLYAGCQFTSAGGRLANRVARWNGNKWSALGEGIGDETAVVYALKASGMHLYAGGSFTNAGSIRADNVAVWDGSGWPVSVPYGSDNWQVYRARRGP